MANSSGIKLCWRWEGLRALSLGLSWRLQRKDCLFLSFCLPLPFSLSPYLKAFPLCLSVCLSVSVSHTHVHTTWEYQLCVLGFFLCRKPWQGSLKILSDFGLFLKGHVCWLSPYPEEWGSLELHLLGVERMRGNRMKHGPYGEGLTEESQCRWFQSFQKSN